VNMQLRPRGVYVLDGLHYAALPNEEKDGAYAYALATVEVEGAAFRMAESQDFSLFVDTDGTIFSVYHADKRAQGFDDSDLIDTGATV
jgi:hypothetical protein